MTPDTKPASPAADDALLAALSAKATQGEWLGARDDDPLGNIYEDNSLGTIIAQFNGWQYVWRNIEEAKANAELARRLVNRYRATPPAPTFADGGWLATEREIAAICRDWTAGDTPAHMLLDRLLDVMERHEATDGGWQDISTAPRDGTKILVARDMDAFGWILGYSRWEGSGFISGWVSVGFGVFGELGLAAPTHWQPLPSPPRTSRPGGE